MLSSKLACDQMKCLILGSGSLTQATYKIVLTRNVEQNWGFRSTTLSTNKSASINPTIVWSVSRNSEIIAAAVSLLIGTFVQYEISISSSRLSQRGRNRSDERTIGLAGDICCTKVSVCAAGSAGFSKGEIPKDVISIGT